jgi:hypothetical protein
VSQLSLFSLTIYILLQISTFLFSPLAINGIILHAFHQFGKIIVFNIFTTLVNFGNCCVVAIYKENNFRVDFIQTMSFISSNKKMTEQRETQNIIKPENIILFFSLIFNL